MIEPTFGPGSGWLSLGLMVPTSHGHYIARRQAAFSCVVFPMRRRGARVPAAEVMEREPSTGYLVAELSGGSGEWLAVLFEEDMRTELLRLVKAQLVPQGGGFRVYQGFAREAGELAPQTWFCAPSAERGRQQLAVMAARESWQTPD